MTAGPETTNTSYNGGDADPGGSNRDARDARGDQPTSFARKWRERRASRVLREDERPDQGPRRGGGTPWREDLPSPWCVLQDYREGADHFGREAALAKAAYWAWAATPLAFNKLMALGHIGSQRPARFWGALAVLAVFVIICWRVAS